MGKKNKFNNTLGAEREVLDFSGNTWSYKGEIPDYSIQADGFSYDIHDADGNDKNAISLGILGMIIIVLNAKSTKIKEEDLLPNFNSVTSTRGWNIVNSKDANNYAKIAIKKLTNSATSGDIFDLASYAPLEIKRALLKKLFVIARYRIPAEFKNEAEARITEDIVPNIFENPEYELAQLTGLIVKPEAAKTVLPPTPVFEQAPVVQEPAAPVFTPAPAPVAEQPVPAPAAGGMSAFEELQQLYRAPEAPAPAAAEAAPTPVIPEPAMPNFSAQPAAASVEIPQPAMPNFSIPQPPMPSFASQMPAPAPQQAPEQQPAAPVYPQQQYRQMPMQQPYYGQQMPQQYNPQMAQQYPQQMQQPYYGQQMPQQYNPQMGQQMPQQMQGYPQQPYPMQGYPQPYPNNGQQNPQSQQSK